MDAPAQRKRPPKNVLNLKMVDIGVFIILDKIKFLIKIQKSNILERFLVWVIITYT